MLALPTADGLAEKDLSLWPAVAFAVGLFLIGTVASWLFSRVEDKVTVERSEAIEDAVIDS